MIVLRKPLSIVLFVLVFFSFFGIYPIKNTLLLTLLLPFIIWGLRNEKLYFRNTLLVLFLSLFANMVSCNIYHDQSISDSIKALAFYYYIFFYFALCYIRPTAKNIDKALGILCLIFNALYIVQFYLLPMGIVFLPVDETSIYLEEGARFHMIGSGLASLSIFLGVNQFLSKRRYIYLLLAASGLLVLVLMAFRTMVVLSVMFIIYELFLVKGAKKSSFIYLALFALIMLLLLQIPVVADKIDYMWEKQFGEGTQHSFANKDYIRWITLDYYYNSYFHDKIELFLGSGYPVVNGSYYKNIENSLWANGIFWMDWGILGLTWMIGIPAVLAMLYYCYKVFRIRIDKNYYYLPVWFFYLLCSSITTAEFFRQGNFIIQALCLYLAERIYLDNKLKIKKCSQS